MHTSQIEAVQGARTAFRMLRDGQPLAPHHVSAVERGLEQDETGEVADMLVKHTIKHGSGLADKLYQVTDDMLTDEDWTLDD
jgi:hypothetical protein